VRSAPPRSIPREPELTIEDALEAFDRWNDGDPGPAYGTVVLFNAHRASLEELTRDVLLDRGLDPETWRECTDTVEAAFKQWLTLDAPYVRPADPGPDVGRAA
jgi:hypothetical protein